MVVVVVVVEKLLYFIDFEYSIYFSFNKFSYVNFYVVCYFSNYMLIFIFLLLGLWCVILKGIVKYIIVI